MSINSKSAICNMALSHLGNYGTISDIDTPTNDKERIFATWYDISRQNLLKMVMPNFALGRIVVSKLVETPPFGYAYYYEYPSRCLKALGIGEAWEKLNNYTIERTPMGVQAISTDVDYADGLNLRFIDDVEDVNSFSPEFKELLSWYLASNVALPITQDVGKANAIIASMPARMSQLSGLNAQENVPIRISHSRFKAARRYPWPDYTDKK